MHVNKNLHESVILKFRTIQQVYIRYTLEVLSTIVVWISDVDWHWILSCVPKFLLTCRLSFHWEVIFQKRHLHSQSSHLPTRDPLSCSLNQRDALDEGFVLVYVTDNKVVVHIYRWKKGIGNLWLILCLSTQGDVSAGKHGSCLVCVHHLGLDIGFHENHYSSADNPKEGMGHSLKIYKLF